MARERSSQGSGADIERAVERLAEDEALRGDLADAGYGVLLAWVAGLAMSRGPRFATTDALYLALRRLLAGAVAAARQRDLAPLLDAAVPPLFSVAELAALRAQPLRLASDPDANATAIAGRLAAITGIALPS